MIKEFIRNVPSRQPQLHCDLVPIQYILYSAYSHSGTHELHSCHHYKDYFHCDKECRPYLKRKLDYTV